MDQDYSESMLKGRMAETLFEELIKASGNTIYRFGYEAIMQNLSQLREKFDRYNPVGDKIRSIPDFIVIDENGKPILIEVKFRWNSQVYDDQDAKRFKAIGKLWNSTMVIVNCSERPYFRVTRPPYFVEEKKLLTSPLISASEFNIKQDVYDEYELLVEKYLKHTLIPQKSV